MIYIFMRHPCTSQSIDTFTYICTFRREFPRNRRTDSTSRTRNKRSLALQREIGVRSRHLVQIVREYAKFRTKCPCLCK